MAAPAQASQPSKAARPYDKMEVQVIFPQYIDAALAPREGRRLTQTQAVLHPTIEEISNALIKLGYKNVYVERKMGMPASQACSKFALIPRGAIKVAIKEPADQHYIKKSEYDSQTRAAVVPGIENKMEVLRRVARMIKESNPNRPEVPTIASVLASVSPAQLKMKK